MMRVYVVPLLIFLSLSSFSQEINIADCIEASVVHGGTNKIDDRCLVLMKKDSDLETVGEDYKLIFTSNVLWTENLSTKKLKKIAGDQTYLDEDVFDFILDEKKEVSILFRHTPHGVEILVHHLSSNGNVAPFIKKTFSQLTPQMTYLYDQERSLLLVEEQGIKVAVLFFDWREELVRLGRAKIIELNDLPTIP